MAFELTELVPDSAVLGSPSFTLHCIGTEFTEASVILWNGAPEPTTYVSATELTTGVNMETATTPIELPVAVQDGVTVSNELPFTFEVPTAPVTVAFHSYGFEPEGTIVIRADTEMRVLDRVVGLVVAAGPPLTILCANRYEPLVQRMIRGLGNLEVREHEPDLEPDGFTVVHEVEV